MILDRIEQAGKYRNIAPDIATALDTLAAGEIPSRASGRYEIDGDRVFALVQEYTTRPDGEVRWEAHRRHIDVQFMVSGSERMGRADIESLRVAVPFDERSDAVILEGEGDAFRVSAGMFAIFFPHDAHRPTLADGEPARVKKVVIKIRID